MFTAFPWAAYRSYSKVIGAFLTLGNGADAIAALDEWYSVSGTSPADGPAWMMTAYALALVHLGKCDTAEHLTEFNLERDPTDAWLRYVRARVLSAVGKAQEATSLLQTLLAEEQLRPWTELAYHELVIAGAHSERYPALIDEAVGLVPTAPELHAARAVNCAQRGMSDEALASFRMAIILVPRESQVWARYARAFRARRAGTDSRERSDAISGEDCARAPKRAVSAGHRPGDRQRRLFGLDQSGPTEADLCFLPTAPTYFYVASPCQ